MKNETQEQQKVDTQRARKTGFAVSAGISAGMGIQEVCKDVCGNNDLCMKNCREQLAGIGDVESYEVG